VTVHELLAAAAGTGLAERVDAVGDALETGSPEAAAAELDAVTGEPVAPLARRAPSPAGAGGGRAMA